MWMANWIDGKKTIFPLLWTREDKVYYLANFWDWYLTFVKQWNWIPFQIAVVDFFNIGDICISGDDYLH